MNRNVWCALYLIVLFSFVGYEAASAWGSRYVTATVVGSSRDYVNGRLQLPETVTMHYADATVVESMNCDLSFFMDLNAGLNMTYTPGSILHGPELEFQFNALPQGCQGPDLG